MRKMFQMVIDSLPDFASSSHHDLIVQRLSRLGIPEDNLNQGQIGLVAFAKSKRSNIQALVSAVLPAEEEEVDEDAFGESMIWLQWLMFQGEPEAALEHLARQSGNQQGVCGAVWGNNDIAYRCRSCEHDPTCAICVPCFENGNHEGHDYSIIYTGGGCCDCGDITAWKRKGFCSKHRGAEQIQPLPDHVANTLAPVLGYLLSYWNKKLRSAEILSAGRPRAANRDLELQKAADCLTSAVVKMLLDFCKHSESLLSFISRRVYSSAGLLYTLLKAERFINASIVGKLHELLLKLLGEPIFKYEFAKVFVIYYPSIIDAAISKCNDNVFKRYPLLPTFSVQILTVPTLTPRLVEEMNLLGVLLQCLENIFISCAGEDGKLQVGKWGNLYETTLRVIEDIRFVMSHSAVPKYICQNRRELVSTWMRLLASVQGMNAQKRETGSHIEDENENIHLPFVLCHSMSNILSLLVAGAFSVTSEEDTYDEVFFSTYKLDCEDQYSLRHAKVGSLTEESSIGCITGKSTLDHETKVTGVSPIPPSAVWLIYECLRSMENWLGSDKTVGPLSALSLKTSGGSGNDSLPLLSNLRKSRCTFKSPSSKVSMSNKAQNERLSPSKGVLTFGVRLDSGQPMVQEAGAGSSEENMLEEESSSKFEGLRILSLSGWPDISYDVSSQDISIHIPLHRLLSMVLLRALKECYGEHGSSYMLCDSSADQSIPRYGDLLCQILEGCHPYGFSAYVMEHPLRIRVFCAEVRAGMWRRNGDAPILFSEWYRSVRWSEQGQELDLFLLQCCAALAPPDLFVHRVLDRFGLSNFLSLNLEQPREQEPILVAEMLTLLVQIVKERRFCGLTPAECLQRELVHKLSIGDATRSQLVKSLPRDLSKNKKLQEVLDTVAEYSHPSGMTQGMYKLRSQYWKELDLYHPRWNSRDQQAAEERYLRFCNVSSLITQLPKWTKIYYPLREIAKVATCKTLLQIVHAVLFYAVFTDKVTTSRAPDGVLLTALHLLALALDVCQVHRDTGDPLCYSGDVIPLLEFACEEICTSKYGDHSMLSLLVLLMRMHEKENAENFVEPGDFSMSSLLLSIIKKLFELEPRCMATLQKLAPQLANQFSRSTLNNNAKDTEPDSDGEKRKAKSRERQAAILEKMRAQQSKFLESFKSDGDDDMDEAITEQEVCDSEVANHIQKFAPVICSLCHDPKSKDPLSFLVLLQKSRLLSFVGGEPLTWEQVGHSGKEQVFVSINSSANISTGSIHISSEMNNSSQSVEFVKSAVNDFASIGQPREVNAFVEFVKARFPSIKNVQLPSMSKDARKRTSYSIKAWEEEIYSFIRGSPSSSNILDSQKTDAKCPTAGSSTERRGNAESLLLGKYIAALPKETLDHSSASQNDHSPSGRMQSQTNTFHPGNDKFGPSGGDGIYVSSCGHAVHQGCLDRYLASLRERFIRRIVFEGRQILDPDQGEFLCPVCRGLANSVLPDLSGNITKVPHTPVGPTIQIMNASSPSSSTDTEGSLLLQDALLLLQRAADIGGSSEIINALPATDVRAQPSLEPTLHLLCGMYYPGQKNILESGRVSHSLILWDTLKYSIMSAEIASRSRKSSLSPNYSLGALYKELNSSSGFILSLLLNVTQSTRTTDYPTVLLRFQGMQLFAKSLCYGTSPSASSNFSYGQGVNAMLYILENAEEVRYPDIQLCRQATEPVLAHDAFSSLMWMLFCLPWPLLSCKDSFLSLVHVFYIVTVTQAIITYCKKGRSIESDVVSRDSLITDVYRAMEQCEEAVQCFDSYNVDHAYDIKDSISTLTFPYLRQCALLWKLITCPNLSPFGDGAADSLDCETNSLEELPEVEKLEKMFNIPSLSVIFSDETSRLAALRWISHFSEAFEAQHGLTCAPAVPFKLIRLPHLYQDLLQRYIKKCCPYCGTVKEESAICLMCGRLCSPNWKTCCRESGCQTHATACGAGIGVFLLIKKTTILLQRSARQAPWPSPYLDAFGEEDVEMNRGKPLFLNEERYAALTHMVASHGLDRSSKVLRQTTIGIMALLNLGQKIIYASRFRLLLRNLESVDYFFYVQVSVKVNIDLFLTSGRCFRCSEFLAISDILPTSYPFVQFNILLCRIPLPYFVIYSYRCIDVSRFQRLFEFIQRRVAAHEITRVKRENLQAMCSII